MDKAILDQVVKEVAGRHFRLIYPDYRDHLNPEQVQQTIHEELEAVDESLMDYTLVSKQDAMEAVIREVAQRLEIEESNISEGDRNYLEQKFFELDTSDVIGDLMRNTPLTMFYVDLGLRLEEYQASKERVSKILNKLKVKKGDPLYERCRDVAYTLSVNASYGGDLVILFASRPREFYPRPKGRWYLKFTAPDLCIMNRGNGSGHHERWPYPLFIRYKPETLLVDDAQPGYAYASEVCGGLSLNEMIDGKLVKTSIVPSGMFIRTAVNVAAHEAGERERRIDERWSKEHKCTMGDMNFRRHPSNKMEYINDFPCGTICHACGTFWVD